MILGQRERGLKALTFNPLPMSWLDEKFKPIIPTATTLAGGTARYSLSLIGERTYNPYPYRHTQYSTPMLPMSMRLKISRLMLDFSPQFGYSRRKPMKGMKMAKPQTPTKYGETPTPSKKWGKNHDKATPNERGCEKNDNKEHIYQTFRVFLPVRTLSAVNPLAKSLPFISTAAFLTDNGYVARSHNRVFCLGCGKKPKKKKNVSPEPVEDLIRTPEGQYVVVEVNNRGIPFKSVYMMDWNDNTEVLDSL